MFPLVAYLAWRSGGLTRLDWLVPLFVLTSLFTLCTGPGQTLFAYHLAHEDIRRCKSWFISYLLLSLAFYGLFKNTITVAAQFKEILRERQWKVTPRSVSRKS